MVKVAVLEWVWVGSPSLPHRICIYPPGYVIVSPVIINTDNIPSLYMQTVHSKPVEQFFNKNQIIF